MSSAYYEKRWIVCIQYINSEGEKVVGKSPPTTRKAAHKKRRAYNAINPNVKCWVIEVKP